jgi:hypothetical protein
MAGRRVNLVKQEPERPMEDLCNVVVHISFEIPLSEIAAWPPEKQDAFVRGVRKVRELMGRLPQGGRDSGKADR